MSIQATDTAVRTSIVVEAPIEQAFDAFVDRFGSFKPPQHNILQVEIAETVFERHVGGHLYDRGVDGSECRRYSASTSSMSARTCSSRPCCTVFEDAWTSMA